jgi:hypothetical protein
MGHGASEMGSPTDAEMRDIYKSNANNYSREIDELKRNILIKKDNLKGCVVRISEHDLHDGFGNEKEIERLKFHAINFRIPSGYKILEPTVKHPRIFGFFSSGHESSDNEGNDLYFLVHAIIVKPRANVSPAEPREHYIFKRGKKKDIFEASYFKPVIIGKFLKQKTVSYKK